MDLADALTSARSMVPGCTLAALADIEQGLMLGCAADPEIDDAQTDTLAALAAAYLGSAAAGRLDSLLRKTEDRGQPHLEQAVLVADGKITLLLRLPGTPHLVAGFSVAGNEPPLELLAQARLALAPIEAVEIPR